MKGLGKVLLLIGAVLMFVYSIFDLINLITTIVKTPDVLFKTDPAFAGIVALIITIVTIIISLLVGYYGITFAVKNKNRTIVMVASWIMLILVIIDIVNFVVGLTKGGAFNWSSVSGVAFGSLASILYFVGYFLNTKKKAR